MKLTSQEEYGLRCILRLAREQNCSPETEALQTKSVTIAQIAETEGLSTEYASKLMGILTKSGLVESVRGRHGGYRLARRADQICISESLAVLGDKFYKRETCDRFSGDHSLCVHTGACSIRSLWSGVQLLLDHVLTRTTLQDLVSLSERNVADWMRSHLEAISELEPLRRASGEVGLGEVSGSNVSGSNVVVRTTHEH